MNTSEAGYLNHQNDGCFEQREKDESDGRLRYQIHDEQGRLVDEGCSLYPIERRFPCINALAFEVVGAWVNRKTPYSVTSVDRWHTARFGETWQVKLTAHLKHPRYTERVPAQTFTVELVP